MSYNDADRMEMTQKEDKKRNNTLDDGSSVADAKGKTRQKNITILHEFYYHRVERALVINFFNNFRSSQYSKHN